MLHTRLPIAQRREDLKLDTGSPREQPMLDIVLIVAGSAAFVLAVAYAYACDKL